MSGFGPLLVVIFALINKKGLWKITGFDLICGVLAIFALIIYIITHKLAISILFAILSDGLAAVPTIQKSWIFSESESIFAYLGGIINNGLSLLVINSWMFSIYSFSIYIIIINTIIIFSIYHKKIFNFIKLSARP